MSSHKLCKTETKLGIVNSEKETAVKKSHATPNTTWFNGIRRVFKNTEHSWGFNEKLAEAAKDETTSFKSAGAKVQVQILKIKNKFVTNHL